MHKVVCQTGVGVPKETTEAAQIGYISPLHMFFIDVCLQSMSLVHFAACHTLVCNPSFVD